MLDQNSCLNIIGERKILEWIVKWVGSFISNRTTLCLARYNTCVSPTHSVIHQGSLLSPILFLFYNAKIVEAYNYLTRLVSRTGTVDNVNALAFSKSTDKKWRKL